MSTLLDHAARMMADRASAKPTHLLFIATIFLLLYVLAFTPAIPVSDQWELVPLLTNPTLPALVSQHNEHRIFFPRLIYLSLARLTRWDTRAETITSLAFFVTLIFLIYKSFARRIEDPLARRLFAFALLTQLSPIHHENLLWGWQLQLTLCVLMVFIGIYNSVDAQARSRTIVGLIAPLLIASFSFMTGLLGWMACIFAIIFSRRMQAGPFLLFALAACVTIIAYFRGFHFVGALPLHATSLLNVLAYFVVFMGANFVPTYKVGQFLQPLLILTGAWGFIWITLGILLVVKTLNLPRNRTVLPYAMMLFGVLAAATMAIGRVDFGLQYALLSRYHMFQMFYWVGCVWIGVLYLLNRGWLSRCSKWLIGFFALLTAISWIGGIGLGVIKRSRLERVEMELKSKGENLSAEAAQAIYHDSRTLRVRIRALRGMRYNVFRE